MTQLISITNQTTIQEVTDQLADLIKREDEYSMTLRLSLDKYNALNIQIDDYELHTEGKNTYAHKNTEYNFIAEDNSEEVAQEILKTLTASERHALLIALQK